MPQFAIPAAILGAGALGVGGSLWGASKARKEQRRFASQGAPPPMQFQVSPEEQANIDARRSRLGELIPRIGVEAPERAAERGKLRESFIERVRPGIVEDFGRFRTDTTARAAATGRSGSSFLAQRLGDIDRREGAQLGKLREGAELFSEDLRQGDEQRLLAQIQALESGLSPDVARGLARGRAFEDRVRLSELTRQFESNQALETSQMQQQGFSDAAGGMGQAMMLAFLLKGKGGGGGGQVGLSGPNTTPFGVPIG